MRVVRIATFLIIQPALVLSETNVELELLLLADTSSSIEGNEFDLQINGYANAFRDPQVIAAIEELGGNGIAVSFVQWSATFQQYDVVPWYRIYDAATAHAFATQVETQARQFIGFGTATGSALAKGNRRFTDNGFQGKRKVIDITSDERSNMGPHPRSVRDNILADGVTINGLAILDDSFDLEGYFREAVIGGPDSFVITAESYNDFVWAIRLKLVREISGAPLN